jgi:hypothetical protein
MYLMHDCSVFYENIYTFKLRRILLLEHIMAVYTIYAALSYYKLLNFVEFLFD